MKTVEVILFFDFTLDCFLFCFQEIFRKGMLQAVLQQILKIEDAKFSIRPIFHYEVSITSKNSQKHAFIAYPLPSASEIWKQLKTFQKFITPSKNEPYGNHWVAFKREISSCTQSVFTASFTDAFLMQVELHSSPNINGNTRNFVFHCCPHRIRGEV